jgi:N-carbamoyl-L-amino-acid hydrolase
LERASADIAAVSGALDGSPTVGCIREASHTGPMPMAKRRDGMRAAARARSRRPTTERGRARVGAASY